MVAQKLALIRAAALRSSARGEGLPVGFHARRRAPVS
jgi:hypothetical protein